MALVYTPTDAIPADLATLELWENGELVTRDNTMQSATSGHGPIAKLIDAAYYLSSGARGGSTRVSSRSEERIVNVEWRTGETGQFAFETGTNYHTWKDAALAGSRIQCALPASTVPHGATLEEVHVYINPAAHGTKPTNMPVVNVISIVASTGAGGNEGTKTDDSVDAAAYSAYHAISVTGLALPIDRETTSYFLGFISESGANSAVDLVIHGHVKLVYTRTTIGED